MRLATSENLIRYQGLCAPISLRVALDRGVRPAVGFSHPSDVLRDPHLTFRQKRKILSSWASDASAVRDEPRLRWLLGTPEPIPLSEVRDALSRLDDAEATALADAEQRSRKRQHRAARKTSVN